MAVTSLWRVKGYIGKVIFYAMNKDKTTEKEIITTENDDTNAETALSDLIAYTERDNATLTKRFVYGINYDPLKAAQNMMKVKKDFEKLDGTVAYHGYQSFKEGEVTLENGARQRLLKSLLNRNTAEMLSISKLIQSLSRTKPGFKIPKKTGKSSRMFMNRL